MLIGDIFPLRTMADRCRAAAHVLCDMDAEFMTLHKRYAPEAIPVDQPVPHPGWCACYKCQGMNPSDSGFQPMKAPKQTPVIHDPLGVAA